MPPTLNTPSEPVSPPRPAYAYGWQRSASIQQWLLAQPWHFEFTQAIRLLEQIRLINEPSRAPSSSTKSYAPLGTGPDPSRESVRLRSHVGFDFPPGEVRTLHPSSDPADPPELTANLFNLAGASAPLPDWVAELLQQQARDQDHGLRDFLDIFHHRLLSIFYRTRVHHRPWLEPVASHSDPTECRSHNRMAQYLLSFSGLGLGELQSRLSIADEEILPYAGLLWQHPRTMVGLERILEHALDIPVRSRQMLGVWRRIEPEDRTRLGTPGINRSLGRTATLGARVWDPQGRFDLILGPVSLPQFLALLPGRPAYQRLRALVHFYAGDLMDARPCLTLEPTQIPRARLGAARLGWTSSIGRKQPTTAQTITLFPL